MKMTRLQSTMRAYVNHLQLKLKLHKLARPFIKRMAHMAIISYVHSDRFQIVYLERQPDELDDVAHAITFNSLGIPVKIDGENIIYLYGLLNCIWLAWKLRKI